MYTPKPSDSVSASVPDGVLFFGSVRLVHPVIRTDTSNTAVVSNIVIVVWNPSALTRLSNSQGQCRKESDRLKSFRINKTLKQRSGLPWISPGLKSFRINKTLKQSIDISTLFSCLKSFRINKTLKPDVRCPLSMIRLKSFRINKTLKHTSTAHITTLSLKSFRINKTLKQCQTCQNQRLVWNPSVLTRLSNLKSSSRRVVIFLH